jgi:trehalose/maltose hydrolase-like predicted phosphorylase
MAGTWMSIVEGFGGMRVKKYLLIFSKFKTQWTTIPLKSILETNYNGCHYHFETTFQWTELKT